MARGISPLLIGAGVLGLAGVGYLLLRKEGGEFDLTKLLDTKWITDYLDSILGKKPTDGDGGGDGNGGTPCVKKTCASGEEWNQTECKCVKKGTTPKPTPKPEPTPTGSIVLGAAGDWGSGRNSNWQKTVAAMKAANVDVMLGLGDYSYTKVGDWQKVIDALKKAGIPVVRGAEGNHDSSAYGKAMGQSSMLYSFTAGPARIIILNTESGASSNASFAEKTLKANKQAWKIMIMHKPLYTGGSNHGEERSLASALKPIINKYGVQLVMYAHNHNYQRIVRTDQPHTVFICSGTGGESHYGIKGSASGTKYKNDSTFGFTKISISGSTLKGQFISTSNKVLDSWSQTATGKVAAVAYAYPAQLEPIGMRISI